MSNPSGAFECDDCGRHFAGSYDLQQHQRHSRRCKAKAYRRSLDRELVARIERRKLAEQDAEQLREAVENITIIAHTFGSRGTVKPWERGMFALAALDTINNMATIALNGGEKCLNHIRA